ncbi:c-type cytochrome domain-containing protein [Spirosoma spitsbergense]|uniref:c-type cytochrome domain-containing protein n=1 Tax=Spirosoma spitsbergense TaxID=431554 RepID=UPI0003692A54|nr:c-type cytochrome domain-containing protein [Spirosoma spitsbergense]
MRNKVIGLAERGLFASAVFILFLLLFESRLDVPVWLQPVGRMHPLLLHFPIVILLLAVGLEAFRFSATPATSEFYRSFASALLLAGAFLAALTVIMGLLLATEPGYTGEVVQWHKWAGVSVFFLASLLYWCRTNSWYSRVVARSGAVVMGLVVVAAGHYGSVITHGADFITEPIIKNRQAAPVDFQQAMVFNDVIKPIFEQKCTSCHNPDKLKGELNLTDADAIRRGGKSGKLFVAGNPDISLLLRRIHLPDTEKKHMPPSGKAQLTPAEIRLLSLWVKGNAALNKRVADLPVTDSLRFIAVAMFKPKEPTEPAFTFDAADDETIKKLNTDYRTIAALARESPALAVNLYNKSAYSAAQLNELGPIKTQVVFLNLNKLPVKDADLAQVGQFENLRKLDLNFTDVTGKGLKELVSLKHLESLALSGTKVAYTDLRNQLRSFKSLKTITLWETPLTDAEINQLKKANQKITFIAGFDGDKNAPIKLNPPQVRNSSVIFSQSLPLKIIHPIRGVELRYTTDGSVPDSVHSAILTSQKVITQSTSVNVKAYKPGWFSSDVATFTFYKSAYKPDSVRLLLPLNPVHQAAGAQTFFDGKLGTFNANSPAWANNWAGFRRNDMVMVSLFDKPVRLSSVALRVMVEEETSIFPPGSIEIWGGENEESLRKLTTLTPDMPVRKSPHELKALVASFPPQPVACLKIIARPLKEIPAWHPNKGNQALLLVDEVFIN